MRKILCVTGKLAERALRATLAGMEEVAEWRVAVLPITVAALMTTEWIARRLNPPPDTDLILIPGLCEGDLAVISDRFGIPAERGPADLKDLPAAFGCQSRRDDYGGYDILIFAEIHHVPRLSREEILRQAEAYRASGADVIDLGCVVGQRWADGAQVISDLKARGFRVSIDTFDPWEIRMAAEAGVDYVLSIHSGNVEAARGLTCPVVVVPDPQGDELESLAATASRLESWGVPYILDPILQPIHFGFAESLYRYVACRKRFPQAEMMIGAHHLTELLDADTTGVNAVVAAFAQELGIRHILTTEVIPWARGSVRELDIARRLMYYSQRHGVLPKHIEDGLLTIKDPRVTYYTEAELREMHRQIRDPNFRIFVDQEWIYVFNNHLFIRDKDPQRIFAQLGVTEASHAFYLGRELERAALAVRLGKSYRQEQPLRWGYLTPPADPHRQHVRLTHTGRRGDSGAAKNAPASPTFSPEGR